MSEAPLFTASSSSILSSSIVTQAFTSFFDTIQSEINRLTSVDAAAQNDLFALKTSFDLAIAQQETKVQVQNELLQKQGDSIQELFQKLNAQTLRSDIMEKNLTDTQAEVTRLTSLIHSQQENQQQKQ